MGSFIMLCIKPELIDAKTWRKTFQDLMEISQQGELSCKQEARMLGNKYVCNKLSEPIYDRRAGANRWIVSGDLVMGLTIDDFSLVDSIQYYRELAAQAIEKDFAEVLEGDLYNEGYLVIWQGDTCQRRAHNWLLAIACIINHRFPDATYIYTASTSMDFIRATGLAGNIIGEPVEIPSLYRVADITEPVSEMIEDVTTEKKYDCNVATDLYYWDNAADTVDPKLDQALKSYMVQFEEFSQKHVEILQRLPSEARFVYMRDLFGENILLSEKAWKYLEQSITDIDRLQPFLGLFSVDTSELAAAQLVNLLATNYKLLIFYWNNYMMQKNEND